VTRWTLSIPDETDRTVRVRIVLDANVLVSALITRGAPPDLLYQAWDAGAFEPITSEPQMDEPARVLAYARLRPFIKQQEAEVLLETTSAWAIVAEGLPDVDLSDGPDDNAILATAIAGVRAIPGCSR
jgi:putative PIN family toxin of toxin-antitoxin system